MRPEIETDIECFHGWFLIGFTDQAGNTWDYHMMPHYPLDIAAVQALVSHYSIVTFNGNHYDLLMLEAALKGYNNEQLKQLNDHIIKSGDWAWATRKKYGLYTPDFIDHIDIIEPVPGVGVGLKICAGRAHAPLLLDSPVDFELPMPYEQIGHETYYCQNDRIITRIVKDSIASRMKLRRVLSGRYGVDLRSKSDAQMAEAIVTAEWQRRVMEKVNRNEDPGCAYAIGYDNKPKIVKRFIVDGYAFKYEAPPYIQFVSPHLQELLRVAQTVDFVVRDKEQLVPMWTVNEEDELILAVPKIKTGVQMPKELHQVIDVNGRGYQMGIGGLHSREKRKSHYTRKGLVKLKTADVAAYYPSLMIALNMVPEALGPLFMDIFIDVKNGRIDAKAAAKRLGELINLTAEQQEELEEYLSTDAGLKIVINGTFGKLWSKHSIFFAPELGVRVTITGQLALLMLIERMELAGIAVVSANTDGVELLVPEGMDAVAILILQWWEKATGLVMEHEDYISLHSRDVNNYVAIYPKGKVKRKGIFRPSGVTENKNPNADVCADAMVSELSGGEKLELFIRGCNDIRKFVVVRKVKHGGYWRGQYLGKAVRWYYGVGGEPIVDANGNKVASSDGAIPIMHMTGVLPADIDYTRYNSIAIAMLEGVGDDQIPF